MYTMTCSVPGLGGATEAKQTTVAEEHVGGKWTFHSYKLSHDGEVKIIQRFDGFGVIVGKDREKRFEVDLLRYNPREFMFHPDSRRFLLWGEMNETQLFPRVMLMDSRSMGGSPPWELAYDPAKVHKTKGKKDEKDVVIPQPFGFEWSPTGDCFFVIEKIFYPNDPKRAWETAIQRIDVPGYRVTEIVRTQGRIDFFMPPVSRFEGGRGPSKKPYRLAFGHREGLFVVDPKAGSEARRISSLPAIGLTNIEWNPDENVEQLLLFFKNKSTGSDGTTFGGVVLVHLDRVGKVEGSEWCEQLYDGTDVHTLWFSPKGTYATWSGKEFVSYRKPLDPRDKMVVIDCRDEVGGLLEVKGVHWHHNERYLAITAGARLFIHDAEKAAKGEKNATVEVARFGNNDTLNFVAEPRWVGDQILLSRVEDITAEAAEYRKVPHFDVKGRKKKNP